MADPSPLIIGVDFVCIPAQDFDAMTTFYGGTPRRRRPPTTR